MSAHALSYGAQELRLSAHRYWLFGLSLSVCIHLTMVCATYLAGPSWQTVAPPRPLPPGGPTVTGRPIMLPGIGPAASGSPILKVGVGGIPVAVSGPVEGSFPTQSELAGSVEPLGRETEAPGGEVHPPAEEEPPPFRPCQIDPRVVLSVTPEYPSLALATGLEGKVWVRIWVDRTGKPRKAIVIKGDEVFSEAALEAAMKFVFTPAIMNDQPVSVWVAIPFVFKLR